MLEGTVIWWNCDVGYGYLKVDGEDVMIHHAALLDGGDLRVGERLLVDVIAGTEGAVAANVRRMA